MRQSELARLAEGQVDTLAAEQRVLAIGEWRDTMEDQPRGSTPDDDVAMLQAVARSLISAFQSTPQEDRVQAERDGDDRRVIILFVAVLVQRQPRARFIAIDEEIGRASCRER